MSAPEPPPIRLPATGPSSQEVSDRDLWEKAAEGSLASVQAAAEKWRTGLAAFVTLVTGGLLLKGPEATKDIDTGYLALLSLLGGGGLLLAVLGLWQALQAAAGSPASLRYEKVLATYGSYRQYQVAAASAASRALAWARKLVAGSLVLLGLTVLVWWWVPTPAEHFLKVAYGDKAVCGKLISADQQRYVILPDGASMKTTVDFDDVTNVYVLDDC